MPGQGEFINIIIGQVYVWSVFATPLGRHFNWRVANVSVAFASIGFAFLCKYLLQQKKKFVEVEVTA